MRVSQSSAIAKRRLATASALLPALLFAFASPAAAQQANGAALFKQRCSACHSVDPESRAGLGPNLRGVVGRAAASAGKASPALAKSRLTWDKATLDRFLAAPAKLVPGTRMPVAVPDPAQRASIISYLATLR